MSEERNGQDGDAPEQRRFDRRSFVRAGTVVAGAAAVGLAARGATRTGEVGQSSETTRSVVAPRVGEVLHDPVDARWEQVPSVDVPMKVQHMVAPRLPHHDLAVEEVRLQVAHTGETVAFRLVWDDDGPDDVEAMGQFRDSVAVQLPVDPSVPTTVAMGQRDRPVHMLHWRASWQRELDEGPRTLRSAFPNAVTELPASAVLGEDAAAMLSPAVREGNVIAARSRSSAVEELIAEGVGTIAAYADQRAEGRGVHDNGRWTVVLTMPMAGGSRQASLRPGGSTLVALAAWDGGRGNRGARKQWSHWVTVELEE